MIINATYTHARNVKLSSNPSVEAVFSQIMQFYIPANYSTCGCHYAADDSANVGVHVNEYFDAFAWTAGRCLCR